LFTIFSLVDAKDIEINHSPEIRFSLDDNDLQCPYYPANQRFIHLSGNVQMKLDKYTPDDTTCQVNISLSSESLIHNDPPSIILTPQEKIKSFKILVKIPVGHTELRGNLVHIHIDWHTVDNMYSGSFKAEIVTVGMYSLSDLYLTIEEETIDLHEWETKMIPYRLDNHGVGGVRIHSYSETEDDTLTVEIVRRHWNGFAGEGSKTGEILISHSDIESGTASVTIVFEDQDSVPAKMVSKTITVNKKVDEPKKSDPELSATFK